MLRHLFIVAAIGAAILPISLARGQSTDLRSIVSAATSKFKDLSMTCVVVSTNKEALKTLGKDFAKSFEFKSTDFKFKCPDKMRVEGKLGMIKVAIITDGGRRRYSVPSLRISRFVDISDRPEQRESDLDAGILSGTLWQDYFVTGVEETDGQYKITFYRDKGHDRKLIAWADAKSLKLLRMERYKYRGPLDVKYVFSDHFLAGGVIWMPRRVEIYTPEGKLAAVTTAKDVKVNSGIPDSLFKT